MSAVGFLRITKINQDSVLALGTFESRWTTTAVDKLHQDYPLKVKHFTF